MGGSGSKDAKPINWRGDGNTSIETLGEVESLYMQQKWHFFEALTGDLLEFRNKYMIYDDQGQGVFLAGEDSGCCMRCCCGPNRSFRMYLYNQANEVAMTAIRKFICCPCPCFSCNLQELKIYRGKVDEFDATEGLVGSVKQPLFGGCFVPRLEYYDANNNKISNVVGPCCFNECCCDAPFDLQMDRGDGGEVVHGELRKLKPQGLSGVLKEAFTDADNFLMTMPKGSSAEERAIILGSSFLVDFMFFEDNQGGCACPVFMMYWCGQKCGMTCFSNGGLCTLYCWGFPIVFKGDG